MSILSGADRELVQCTKFIPNKESEKLLRIRTWNLINCHCLKTILYYYFTPTSSHDLRADTPGSQSIFRKSSRTNVYVESGIKSQFEICPNRIRELVENPSTRVQKSQLTLKIGCVPPAQAAGNPLFARRMRALRRPIRKSGAEGLLGRAPGRRSYPVWAPCPTLPNF